MMTPALKETAAALVARGKGLLAMDESSHTANERFAEAGIPRTEDRRRVWRDLIVTTPGLGDCVSGAILFDETLRQTTLAGVPFAEALSKIGVIPGIKVDAGAKPLAGHPGEGLTEGLDGLRGRLAEYAGMGARFAKWRAVIAIGSDLPSRACVAANARGLALYAALCQEAGLVPIVEPEVLMTGDHTMERCRIVTGETLRTVFAHLHEQGVELDGIILKPGMVLPGAGRGERAGVEAVAAATLRTLLDAVPAPVAGIAFLSGGQTGEEACAHLNAINRQVRARPFGAPWPLTYSFARAIQHPALTLWAGDDANRPVAQHALLHRARCALAALHARYDPAMEREAA